MDEMGAHGVEGPPLAGCPRCGGALEHGFLLGKHGRIRWSSSPEALTIAAGVPLLHRKPGFWRSWRWWFFAPSIAGSRCPRCQLVVFRYDNPAAEHPRRDRIVSLIIGTYLLVCGVALSVTVIWMATLAVTSPAMIVALALLALVVLALPMPFVIHGLRRPRSPASAPRPRTSG